MKNIVEFKSLVFLSIQIPRLATLGPLEEKEDTMGAYDLPNTVPLNKIVAAGLEDEFIYALIFSSTT